MDKVLIQVTSPAANQTYDMFVPSHIQIGELTELIGAVFSQTSGGTYIFNSESLLCEANTGHVFDPNLMVCESKIINGTKIIIY